MSRVINIPGSVNNPALQSADAYHPSIGAPGYDRRYRAIKYPQLVGSQIAQLVNEINGEVLPVASGGTPATAQQVTIGGVTRRVIDTSHGTGAPNIGYRKGGIRYARGATLMAVFALEGNTQQTGIGVMAGRILMDSSSGAEWRLLSAAGALPTGGSIAIPHSTVPRGPGGLYVAIARMPATGADTELTLRRSTGQNAKVVGNVPPSWADISGDTFAIGKTNLQSYGTQDGPEFVEFVTWPRVITTEEAEAVLAYVAETYDIP